MATSTLNKLQAQLQKSYGEAAVVKASEIPPYEICSSGSLAVDQVTGIGGLPTNRVIEIIGSEGAGKTTLSALIIKSFLQKYPDKNAVICDMEHRITEAWVSALIGEDLLERVLLVWPDSAEQATDMYLDCVKSGIVCVFSYDSIGGAPSQRVLDKSATIGNIGGNALAMTRFAQFASIFSDKYKCLTICINQIRADMSGYNRLVGTGGHALLHAYSLRLHLRPGKDKFYDEIGGEKIQVGNKVVVKVVKNSLAAPYRATDYTLYFVPCKYGFGIDVLEETVRLGILTGVIQKAGRFNKHPALPNGQVGSREELLNYLREDQKAQDIVVQEIAEAMKKGHVTGITTTFDIDDDDSETSIEDRLVTIEEED